MCKDSKCTDRICYDKPEGAYCDMRFVFQIPNSESLLLNPKSREENVCNAHKCHNPCSTPDAPHMMVCECPETDPRTGMQSDDRCQLCCFDFKAKRCSNAFRA